MIENSMRPVHPGEVLREEFMKPYRITANGLARALRVPATRVHEIINERRAITPDTALRLARYFGGDARSWLNLQAEYDLKKTRIEHGDDIEREVSPHAA
jgi:addiction module HigA family antidote